MKKLFVFLAPIWLLLACQADPEAIYFGKDACHHCKMTIMDPKFGSEIVTDKGRVYKFDDINCVHSFMAESQLEPDDIRHLLVIDFSQPQELINAYNATYVLSEDLKPPMASNFAAFSTQEAAKEYLDQRSGELMNYQRMLARLD
ncbi:nitrous oxide reductase accessory protein NosL [Litoribacter alkaliphilus]|uniref:Nitrous oxide reductase accessory protein NosL n=1 Tax=Litoribacter ruber TaxID=702568 RepID=A0AAP2G1E4_9BACT|nr:nitrous oxide reductase accessory protein NosL [Litoribacter alkaliphilus]MBS9524479.1 nitrous oxide reductase accessory protein NosL [Litoribacter alkaliphilus]